MGRYKFMPISEAPMDRRALVLGDDSGWLAVGHWAGEMWAIGRPGSGWPVEQLDFEPTKFAFPDGRFAKSAGQGETP